MKQAVGILIQNTNGDFLLMKRSKNTSNYQGKWESCGGKVEVGETPEMAVEREAMEELGIKIISLKLQYISKPDPEHEIFIFKAEIEGIPQIMEKDLCDEIRWVKPSELKDLDLTDYSKADFIHLNII